MQGSKQNSLTAIQIQTEPIKFWDLYRDGITQTTIQRILTCPEKARLSMEEALEPIAKKDSMVFGEIFHDALAKYYGYLKDHKDSAIIEAIIYKIERTYRDRLYKQPIVPKGAEQNLELMIGQVKILLEAYSEWYPKDKKLKWLALEEQFRVPYFPRVQLGLDVERIYLLGKWDGTYHTKREDYRWLFETKTRDYVDINATANILDYEFQVMFYLYAMRAQYGYVPRGIVYNIVRRPQLRQGSKETAAKFLERIKEDVSSRPSFYFHRVEIKISTEKQNAWSKEFDNVMRYVIEWNEGKHRFRNSGSCITRLGVCEFFPCGDKLNKITLTQRKHVFPELVEE